jgi:hypothetical protein
MSSQQQSSPLQSRQQQQQQQQQQQLSWHHSQFKDLFPMGLMITLLVAMLCYLMPSLLLVAVSVIKFILLNMNRIPSQILWKPEPCSSRAPPWITKMLRFIGKVQWWCNGCPTNKKKVSSKSLCHQRKLARLWAKRGKHYKRYWGCTKEEATLLCPHREKSSSSSQQMQQQQQQQKQQQQPLQQQMSGHQQEENDYNFDDGDKHGGSNNNHGSDGGDDQGVNDYGDGDFTNNHGAGDSDDNDDGEDNSNNNEQHPQQQQQEEQEQETSRGVILVETLYGEDLLYENELDQIRLQDPQRAGAEWRRPLYDELLTWFHPQQEVAAAANDSPPPHEDEESMDDSENGSQVDNQDQQNEELHLSFDQMMDFDDDNNGNDGDGEIAVISNAMADIALHTSTLFQQDILRQILVETDTL